MTLDQGACPIARQSWVALGTLGGRWASLATKAMPGRPLRQPHLACPACMQVSKREYVAHGSEALGARLADELRAQGKTPYVVPVGGSNALGCWGYMMALEELAQQTPAGGPFTHIVMVRQHSPNAACHVSAAVDRPCGHVPATTAGQGPR